MRRPVRPGTRQPTPVGFERFNPWWAVASAPDPFTPLQLFTNGEQGAWYAPSDLTTLYQDAAGTTPVTADGDPVGLMLDKSGNGNHASQANSLRRPIYPGLQYDKVDDYLLLPAGLAASQDVFLCGYAAPQDFSGQQDFFELSDNDGKSGVRILVAAGQWYFQAGAGATRLTIVSGSTASGVMTLHLSAGVMTARINGQQVGQMSVSGYAPNAGVSWIGASYAAESIMANYASGVAGSMVTVNRSVTEAEMTNTEHYIAQKHGVTLP